MPVELKRSEIPASSELAHSKQEQTSQHAMIEDMSLARAESINNTSVVALLWNQCGRSPKLGTIVTTPALQQCYHNVAGHLCRTIKKSP